MVGGNPGTGDSKGSNAPCKTRPLLIGVTGHRPDGLLNSDPDLLRTRVDEVLETAIATGRRPVILSPLAEGADRIVAKRALATGLELHCILPFPRDVYALDFSAPASRTEFFSLLSQAHQIVELNGSVQTLSDRNTAYAAVGTYTVEHSEILLAIWDGQIARGLGGTGDVVARALQFGLTIVWISPSGSVPARIISASPSGEIEEDPITALPRLLGTS